MQRGPSEPELARAWLDVELRRHVRLLRRYDEDELLDVMDDMVDLPARDISMQFPLPRLLSPELEALRKAVAQDDDELVDERLEAAVAQLDTPVTRATMGRAVLAAHDAGCIDATMTAAAMLDLATSPSSLLLRSSLLEAIAVSAGSVPTPSGLLIATH